MQQCRAKQHTQLFARSNMAKKALPSVMAPVGIGEWKSKVHHHGRVLFQIRKVPGLGKRLVDITEYHK